MNSGLKRAAEALCLAALVTLCLASAVWAGPPLPPSSTPSVPVGGPGVAAATTLAIVAYGVWKSRR